MPLTIHAACLTDTGRIRSNNEDNFFFHEQYLPELHDGTVEPLRFAFSEKEDHWLAVFDGMGGENYGELASYAAAEALAHSRLQPADFPTAAAYATETAQQLNLSVVEQMRRMKTGHMGTTMAAVYFDGGRAVICNLGDSRVYRLRDGTLWQLSEDHVSTRPMAPGRKAPLTQHLGIDPEELLLEPAVSECRLQAGDCFLLCSDGVTDMLEDEQIGELLRAPGSCAETVQALIDAALKAGGRDNITAIVCRVETDGESMLPIPAPTLSVAAEEKTIEAPGPAERKGPGLGWLVPLLLAAVLALCFLRRGEKDAPPEEAVPEVAEQSPEGMRATVYKAPGVVSRVIEYDAAGKPRMVTWYDPDGSKAYTEIY